jgi:hypothetical protein
MKDEDVVWGYKTIIEFASAQEFNPEFITYVSLTGES